MIAIHVPAIIGSFNFRRKLKNYNRKNIFKKFRLDVENSNVFEFVY